MGDREYFYPVQELARGQRRNKVFWMILTITAAVLGLAFMAITIYADWFSEKSSTISGSSHVISTIGNTLFMFLVIGLVVWMFVSRLKASWRYPLIGDGTPRKVVVDAETQIKIASKVFIIAKGGLDYNDGYIYPNKDEGWNHRDVSEGTLIYYEGSDLDYIWIRPVKDGSLLIFRHMPDYPAGKPYLLEKLITGDQEETNE